MPKRILIPTTVLVSFALMAGVWFARMHKARSANYQLSAAEYAVLSSYINAKFGSAPKVKRLVMLDMTTSDASDPHPELDATGQPISGSELDASLLTKAPVLQRTTIDAFRQANAQAAPLNRSSFAIHAPIIFEVVNSAHIDGIFSKAR